MEATMIRIQTYRDDKFLDTRHHIVRTWLTVKNANIWPSSMTHEVVTHAHLDLWLAQVGQEHNFD